MGCCTTNSNHSVEEIFINKLITAIENNSVRRIKAIYEYFGAKDMVNKPFIDVKGIRLSPLAYALWMGRLKAFKCLYENCFASVVEMETLLLNTNISSLDLVMTLDSEFFLYFIPIYLKYQLFDQKKQLNNDLTMDFDKTISTYTKTDYTPIQKACEIGNLNILFCVQNYFQTNPPAPYTLDFEYQDDQTGENCVLIAARNGNFALLKFLHEVVKADFHVQNKNRENAVLVCLVGSKTSNRGSFYECLRYLVEVADVDIKFKYEESLLLANDWNLINYIENRLILEGITVDKKTIENSWKIRPVAIPKTELEMKLDADDNFLLINYLDNVQQSIISSINPPDSTIDTGFLSAEADSSIRRSLV